jgi:tRNA (adenine37-N6)-methyltransferase
MEQITINPIGVIRSPYKEPENIPIQGVFQKDKKETEAQIELMEKYVPGLKDLEQFSHAIVLYYFHKSDREQLQGKPFLEDCKHGMFAIRSPHRPNHLGLSVIKIKRIVENKIFFTEVDMLDGTPVVDIKPYIKYFDNRENVVSGWLDKHFENGEVPENVIIKK